MAFVIALGVPAAASAATPIPGQYIVVLKDGSSARSVAAEHSRSANARVLQTYAAALDGYTAKLDAAGLAKVKADKRVASVVQDAEGKAVLAQMLPTGVNRIDAEQAPTAVTSSDGTTTTSSVTTPGAVAIYDSGIDTAHPDLNVVGGVNCLGATSTYNDGTIGDQYGHGTHVAGIAGAKDNDAGVVGVAPGVALYSVRDLDARGSGSISSQLCGIDWVTANGPSLGIKVANSSQVMLTSKTDDGNCGYTNGDVLHQAVCRSVAAGITWVWGSGNTPVAFTNGAGPNYPEVLTTTAMGDGNGQPNVGSTVKFTCGSAINTSTKKGGTTYTEIDDKYTTFSSWASSTVASQVNHTVSAPGACIWSTFKGQSYGYMTGTSMSAPHATGTVHRCILAGACTGTPAQIIQKIRADAEAYNRANPWYGFTGDPLHSPVSGRYYGYLLRPGLY